MLQRCMLSTRCTPAWRARRRQTSSVDTFTSLSTLMSVGLCDREECVCEAEAEGRRWEAEGAPAPGTAYGTVARGPPRTARPPPARAQPRRVRVVILYIYCVLAAWCVFKPRLSRKNLSYKIYISHTSHTLVYTCALLMRCNYM